MIVSFVRNLTVSNFLSPSANAEERAAIASLARRLIEVRGAGDAAPALEDEMNRRSHGLFGLGKNEVKIIEQKDS